MKKVMMIGTAALFATVSLAVAQESTSGGPGSELAHEDLFINRDDAGAYRVYGPNNMEGAELLMGENGGQPANCPDGSYFINEDEFSDETEVVRGCNTQDEYEVNAAAGDQMMSSGEPFPDNSYRLTRREN